QLEVGVLGVAVRRVFPDEVGDRDVARAVEANLRVVTGAIELRVIAVLRARLQVREAHPPAMAGANVAAGVGVDHPGSDAILVARRARKVVAVADFGAELEELVGWRDPFHLQAVVSVLATEKGLIRERSIDEIPCMLMLL